MENNLDDLIRFAIEDFRTAAPLYLGEGQGVRLEVFTQKKKRTMILKTTDSTFYHRYKLELINDANADQQKHFIQWTGLNPKY